MPTDSERFSQLQTARETMNAQERSLAVSAFRRMKATCRSCEFCSSDEYISQYHTKSCFLLSVPLFRYTCAGCQRAGREHADIADIVQRRREDREDDEDEDEDGGEDKENQRPADVRPEPPNQQRSQQTANNQSSGTEQAAV